MKKIGIENLITHDDFLGVSRRCHYNQFIAEFYERFAKESDVPYLTVDGEVKYGPDPNYTRVANRVRNCSSNWTFDFFKTAACKQLVRVERCDDRFCLNCQALKADQRFAQYSPILDSYANNYDLYHIVFTVPNVDDIHLSSTIELMFDRFSYLLRFFDGRKKIKGLDLLKYGYQGAVRALEITVSKKNGTYHPHLHCIFILKKDLILPKVFWNRYSEDKTGRTPTRLFSELEILLQRMWCLLILRVKLTKDSIENTGKYCSYPDGFTLTADLANGDYHEIFKYAIKGSFKNETLFKYEAFLTLYKALFRRRAYETYGCLKSYDFNEVDEDLGLFSIDDAFETFISHLQTVELPVRVEELLTSILSDSAKEKFKYVSKATFVRHFKALSEEDKKEFFEKIEREVVQLEIIPEGKKHKRKD